MTALSKQHFVDERGYVCCHVCGWVLQDFSAELPIDHSIPRYNPDHYAQLAHKRAGALPTVHGRKGRYALTRVLGDSGRRLLAKDANVLRDADALCSMLDVRGDVKGAVMHAVETFYDGAPRRGVSIEAALIALTEAVVRGFGGTLDTPKALRAFNVSNDQIAHARKSVGTWFATYWKGDKR